MPKKVASKTSSCHHSTDEAWPASLASSIPCFSFKLLLTRRPSATSTRKSRSCQPEGEKKNTRANWPCQVSIAQEPLGFASFFFAVHASRASWLFQCEFCIYLHVAWHSCPCMAQYEAFWHCHRVVHDCHDTLQFNFPMQTWG